MLKKPPAAMLFTIISFNELEYYFKFKKYSEDTFSELLYESQPMPKWTLSDAEKIHTVVGGNTRIISFKRKINREEIVEITRKCMQFQVSSISKDPCFRIIPGYLCLHNVIISSTLEDYHRIYLYNGVYAEIIYKYEMRKFHPVTTAPKFFSISDVLYFYTILRDFYVQANQNFLL